MCEKLVFVVVSVNGFKHHSFEFHEQPIASRKLNGISKDSRLPVVSSGSFMRD